MDADIWDSGYNHARISGYPDELDFLRGFHNLGSLNRLRNWLQTYSGSNVRLTSVWQDKYGNVVPSPLAPGPQYKYQEVADLAIIVRDAQNRHTSAWMWLLQAKVTSNSRGRLPPGNSTDREIYLYESMPPFTWHGKQSLRFTFQLQKDFRGPVEHYKHWSFLCFRENAQPIPADKFIDVRWPGSLLLPVVPVASFCDELLKLVTHFSVGSAQVTTYGAPLAPHPEWEKLAQQILYQAHLKPQFGHASRVKGQQADVLMCAMLAESRAGMLMWTDAEGRNCDAACDICFPGISSEGILYSSISTGFDQYDPEFDLSQAMQEKWDTAGSKSRDENREKGNDDGGSEPPGGGDQGDGVDGGSGAKLTLFVDVAKREAED